MGAEAIAWGAEERRGKGGEGRRIKRVTRAMSSIFRIIAS